VSILVIAEKPSVGMSIATVLGAKDKKDGYMEGGGYIVSWCFGHLAHLANADAYGDYGKWRQEDLPILPREWKTVVMPDKRKQFDILRGLMDRPDVESLVCATDAGREGELIFRFVYEQAVCIKPFKRLWISSMEESAIKDGFEKLKDGAEYDSLYASAICRARADWLIGINATRLFSVLYGKTLSVGRVQSPTLAMLAERGKEIKDFIKEKYYRVRLDMSGGVQARSERIESADEAAKVREACDGKQATCTKIKSDQKTSAPPKLFDLTALQREANKLFGYTAKQTLDLAQSLYEKKLLTYPRTDSRYLTSDMAAGVSSLVGIAAALIGSGGNFPANTRAVINDAKVSDHHAIIITATASGADIRALSETERNTLLLVAARLICAVGDKHIYEAVCAEFSCGAAVFTAKGRTVLADGWKMADTLFKNVLKMKEDAADGEDTDVCSLPPVSEGQTFEDVAATVTEHFTSPPKPYSEATLLSAMETAGAALVADEAERKGLGTPATRAAVIENLIARGFAKRKGKQLLPTDDGSNLMKILPDTLKSPALTSEWENTLALISRGEASPDDFMQGIEDLTAEIVRENGKANDALACMFSPGKEIIGVCPRCGKNVHEGKKNFYCVNRSCGFVMWKNDRFFERRKKELTKAVATALLKDGKANVKGLYSEKSGKTYDALILLADTGGKYVNYRFAPRD
jgi:DNA topoisomerase-3